MPAKPTVRLAPLAAFAVLALINVAVAALGVHPSARPGPSGSVGAPSTTGDPVVARLPAPVPVAPTAPAPTLRPQAALALVIDDWGYAWAAAPAFLKLPPAVTISVLPDLPDSRSQAVAAAAAGHEVLLHLPMQPQDAHLKLGPGGITTGMSDAEIGKLVSADIAAVPDIIGINNHEGSAATADPRVMRVVLQVAEQHQLFFLDSRTTSKSVVPEVAAELHLPYNHNSLFIDNDPDPVAIEARLTQAAEMALAAGSVVAIGHVHPTTLTAIRAMEPKLSKMGVRLVPLTDVLVGYSGVRAAPAPAAGSGAAR